MKRAKLKNQLTLLTQADSTKVLLATETGSRRWGFHSEDSDYDVRFIFRRAEQHVFSLFPRGDTLEKTVKVDGEILDMVGWELGKALMLMRKGNCQPFEWLSYADPYTESEETKYLRELMMPAWNPKKAIEHYLGIARGNWRKYITKADEPAQKRYLYVIRGVVNARWVTQFGSIPPADLFYTLSAVNGLGAEFVESANELIHRKRARELDGVGRITAIDRMMYKAWSGTFGATLGLFHSSHKPSAFPTKQEIDELWRMLTKCEWPDSST